MMFSHKVKCTSQLFLTIVIQLLILLVFPFRLTQCVTATCHKRYLFHVKMSFCPNHPQHNWVHCRAVWLIFVTFQNNAIANAHHNQSYYDPPEGHYKVLTLVKGCMKLHFILFFYITSNHSQWNTLQNLTCPNPFKTFYVDVLELNQLSLAER